MRPKSQASRVLAFGPAIPGFPEIEQVKGGVEALASLGGQLPSIVLVDLDAPGLEVEALLAAVGDEWPRARVVLLSGPEGVGQAIQHVRRGAFAYLRRPFVHEELTLLLERASASARSGSSATKPPRNEGSGPFRFGLLGQSAEMRQVAQLIEQVAWADTTVLLEGESGTGKELVARAIHRRSPRSAGRFVPVNCGAIPRELMESELFGHVAGAFSGAVRSKRGLVEEANGGTLFLDEVSELDPSLQVKLLRVLQEREVRPVGDTVVRAVDPRFIGATNRDLALEVEQGRFRQDLFFRLQVFPICIPPLRERVEDLPDLVTHYLAVYAQKLRKEITGVDSDAMAALERYAWPGNVRELINMIERATLLEPSTSLSLRSFPALQRERPASGFWEPPVEFLTYKAYMGGVTDRAQHRYFTKVLRRFHGNVSDAAKHAQIKRETVHRLLKKLGISAKDYRSSGKA